MTRRLLTCAAMLLALVGVPQDVAAQEPMRHELLDYQFEDGGRASGYVVILDNFLGGTVFDWSVVVTGGNQGLFPPHVYDPTNSTARLSNDPFGPSVFYIEALGQLCNDERRRMIFRPGRNETHCGANRRQVSGVLAPVAAPIIMLKVNGLHPTGRVVPSLSAVSVRLEMYRGGWPNELDFYWMVQLDGQLRWVTPEGLSETPGRLARVAPYAYGTTLIDQVFPLGTVLTNALFAVDGVSILGSDVITAVVIAPPPP